MKKVLSVLLALCLLIGTVPVFTLAADDDPPAEPQPETKQLYVNWLEVHTEWDEETEEDIPHFIKHSDNYGNDFKILPIEEYGYFVFAIETGEDEYEDVPISELKVSEGAALEEPKSLPEDSKEFEGKVGKLTVDSFDKDYVVSYERGDDVYEIHFNSYAYGPFFYSKPEMDNKNIILYKDYNVLGEQPVVYLGIKMDPEWEGVRRVKSVALSDDMKGLTLLAIEGGAFWQITMDKEAMTDDGHAWDVDVQWEYKDEDGNWVEEDVSEPAGIFVRPVDTLAYSTTDLIGDNEHVLLKDVKDKLSTELELTVGGKKNIYPVAVSTMEVDGKDQWIIYPIFSYGVDSADKKIATADPNEFVYRMEPYAQITAVSAGSTELQYCLFDVGILDETTGEFLGDSDAWMEYLSNIYDGIEGLEPDIESWLDEGGGLHYSLVITPDEGDEIDHPMDIRRGDVLDWPEHGITVKVNPAVKFSDVKDGAYYADAVAWAVGNGITAGIGGGRFAPGQTCKREQIVTFLYRSKGSPAVSVTDEFTDMPKNEEFQRAISWAVKNNITVGNGKGKFNPEKGCTRAEAMTFIWRAAGNPEPKTTATFSDMPSNQEFCKAISWAVENGIAHGTGNNKFSPNETCRREHIVTFLYNAR